VVGLVGGDVAAVPEIALVLGEDLRRRRNKDVVGGLAEMARRFTGGGQDPVEARPGCVEAEGIDEIFAAQALEGDDGCRGFRSAGGGRE
jgi:hypothetical protein